MSYILDALRRADAERERGQVPGLHSRADGPLAATGPDRRRTGLWLALVGGGLLITGLAVLLLQRPGAPAPSPEPPAQAEPLAAAAARPAPPAPVAPQPAPTPAPAAEWRVAPPAPAPVTATPRATRAPKAALPVPAEAVDPAPQPKVAGEPRDDLPAALRRELPKLVVSGSVYSEEAASRFLIVNGEVVHEGDKLGPELSVEQIATKEAWLRFRGYRVKLPL